MPLTYQIDAAAGLLLIIGEGEITQIDRLEGMRAWRSDPAYRPGLATLCDFSAAIGAPTFEELQQLVAVVERNATAIGRKRVAIVTRRPVGFGAARQFQALSDSSPVVVNVFTERADAMTWLLAEDVE